MFCERTVCSLSTSRLDSHKHRLNARKHRLNARKHRLNARKHRLDSRSAAQDDEEHEEEDEGAPLAKGKGSSKAKAQRVAQVLPWSL